MVKNTSLDVSKIKHKYDDKNFVLKEINFDILEGDILSILGPSGCGKSTLLRLIAGLEKLKYGKIEIFGKFNAVKVLFINPLLPNIKTRPRMAIKTGKINGAPRRETIRFFPVKFLLANALAIGMLIAQLKNADKSACFTVNLTADQSPEVRT